MDLLTAVKVESLEKIKEIVNKQGIPCDSKWIDYKTLNVALAYGRKDVAMFLLNQNCRVNKTKKSPTRESTPLHNAVKLGDVQIVKQLLEKQASVLAIDSEKNTPLHLAFINKHEMLVDLILDNIQQTSNHINLKNNQGLSHMHIACTAKNGQTIQGFLDAGANVDEAVDEKSPSWAGFTAQHFAVHYKCLEAVSILLKLDAKHESKSSEGKTPLDIAQQNVEDWLIIIDLLKKKSSDSNLRYSLSNFHVACLRENDRVVENFIKHGAEVNSTLYTHLHIPWSSSSLHFAVESKCKKIVELLLKHGSKVDCTNFQDMTPLHLAVYNEQPESKRYLSPEEREGTEGKEATEIADLLYAAVENKMLDQEDVYGMSYFHIAITRNDIVTVKEYLDKNKANLNKIILKNPYQFSKYSPLHLAVEYHHPEIVELLVNCGANVNAIGETDETPFHMAVMKGNIDFIELFLKKGAKVDLSNDESYTVLHMLMEHCISDECLPPGNQLNGNKEAILMYIEHFIKLGVDVNAVNDWERTALYAAIEAWDEDVSYFELLLNLGADVNVKDIDGDLPIQVVTDTNSDTYDSQGFHIYYHHVQKMKALGVPVHPRNEEVCEKIAKNGNFKEGELALKEQQRLDEVAKLKSIKLGEVTTLCDFLKLDSRRAALFAQCKTLKKIAMDSELKEKYPLYGYLIRLQYNMAVKSYKSKYSHQHNEFKVCDKCVSIA